MRIFRAHEAFEKIVGYTHQPRLTTALFLMIISNLGWIFPLLILPMKYVDIERKAVYITLWIIFGQLTYNIGFFIAGAEMIKRLHNKGITLHGIHTQLVLFARSITRKFPHR